MLLAGSRVGNHDKCQADESKRHGDKGSLKRCTDLIGQLPQVVSLWMSSRPNKKQSLFQTSSREGSQQPQEKTRYRRTAE